ncbi:unnamed protein product [Caenorhabditis angaria]|uniref:DUF38 domain-containing protein n=1 Tax=Caenorhabditis angaria TaxID=860376 RepID=A0A9P1IRM1_9PELO|nr:unnamed protein product [Caenorhabditis angaria]
MKIFVLLYFFLKIAETKKLKALDVARILIDQYSLALETRNRELLEEYTSENFKLFACERENNYYLTRNQIFESISEIPMNLLKLRSSIIVSEAKFFKFGAMQIRTIVDFKYKVNFDAKLPAKGGKYQLTMEYDRDCPEEVPLTSMFLDYSKMAEVLGKNLMIQFVESVQGVREIFIEPYVLQFCDFDGRFHEIIFEDFANSIPDFIDLENKTKTWLTAIQNAYFESDGTLCFEVHGGGFNHYYEAVIKNGKYRIKLDKHLQCLPFQPKSLEFEVLQHSVFN